MEQENIVSATLMCLMEHDQMDKVDLTFEFMRILQQANVSEHELEFLYGFFHTYVKLTKEEEEKLMIKIKKNGRVHELPKLTNIFEERGEKQEKERIVLNMLKKGMDTELIKEITGLCKEDTKKL